MSRPSDLSALARAAARLARGSAARNRRLPPLLVLTDPARTGDPIALAERLGPGAGLIYRTFGAPQAREVAFALGRLARRRGFVLLIGADAALAAACGAHGVHLPERRLSSAPRLRARWPGVLITGAAHGAIALRRGHALGLDAALVSTVFDSASPSARAPMGPIRLASRVRLAPGLAVYALGGVDASTLPRLAETGVAGVAGVGVGSDCRRIGDDRSDPALSPRGAGYGLGRE